MEIPDSYPDKLSDEELQEIISKCAERSVRATKKNSNYSLGPAFYNSMAELGINEMNKRIQSRLLIELEKQRKNNEKAQLTNRILTVITISLALVTLYIGSQSLKFSEVDMESDTQWQQEQIEQLKQNNEILNSINMKMIKEKNDSINKKTIDK